MGEGCFCKKSGKRGCFVKKWTFPQRRVHFVQYQYFLFYILLIWGRVRALRTPGLRACVWTVESIWLVQVGLGPRQGSMHTSVVCRKPSVLCIQCKNFFGEWWGVGVVSRGQRAVKRVCECVCVCV